MKNVENFKFDFDPKLVRSDYWSYFTRKTKQDVLKYGMGFFGALIAYILVSSLTIIPLLTILAKGIIFFFFIMILMELFDLFQINRQLKKADLQQMSGKYNLIVQNNSIEVIHPLGKRVIFISQLKKLLNINEVLYFIEKKSKAFPLKINKTEMSHGSFERLISVLESKRIKIEK